jgi:hypothetical protein
MRTLTLVGSFCNCKQVIEQCMQILQRSVVRAHTKRKVDAIMKFSIRNIKRLKQ